MRGLSLAVAARRAASHPAAALRQSLRRLGIKHPLAHALDPAPDVA